MTSLAPSVALLFDDVALGDQLREALIERGARIVYEGAVSSLSRALLEKVGADVLVVNLDDVADDALDSLYESIEGSNRKLVFNDGHASSGLTGWDRARWARHLALKVFEAGEIDPPRPENARLIETAERPLVIEVVPMAAAASSHDPSGHDATGFATSGPFALGLEPAGDSAFSDDFPSINPADREPTEMNFSEAFSLDASSTPVAVGAVDVADAMEPSWSVETAPSAPADDFKSDLTELFSFDDLPASFEGEDEDHGHTVREESENLAAELEALLASEGLATDDESPSGTGLHFSHADELPTLPDGDFGLPRSAADDDDPFGMSALETTFEADAMPVSAVTPREFQLDHLELAPRLVAVATTVYAPPADNAASKSVSAPDSWSLVVDDQVPAQNHQKASPNEFGIEKISTTDFLASDGGNAQGQSDLAMDIYGMSAEEAVGPKAFEQLNPLWRDGPDGELTQVVLLGASVSGAAAVCDFLMALPVDTQLFFLHTQHFGDTPAEEMVAKFARHSSLPVRLAKHGARAKGGEVLVAPSGQSLLLRRDGIVELQANDSHALNDHIIDASFSMAAGVFTHSALAIVFAGLGNDAVAGSQAVHDRGGKVWVESSAGEPFDDMVSGIVLERLVDFFGSPHELAAQLIEVYA